MKLISGGMQFLARHNKYDKIISLHNITLISDTITWQKLIVQQQYLAQRMNIVLATKTLKIGE
jgi:hypothetical protein